MKIVSNGKPVSEHAIWLGTEFDKELGFGWNPFKHYMDYAKEHNLVVVYGGGWDNVTVSVNGEEWCECIEFPIEEGGCFYINKSGELKRQSDSGITEDFKKITCNYVGNRNVHLYWKLSTEIPCVEWRQTNDENRIHSYCLVFCLDDM